MSALLAAVLALPLLGALLAGTAPPGRRVGVALAGSNVVLLALVVALAAADSSGGVVALGGLLRADPLGATMVVLVGAVASLASWQSIRYLDGELAAARCAARDARRYWVLVELFVATMLLALLAANLGVTWIAIEATTISTTFLVGHRRSRKALEASWKYLVICTVGIALAFLGTVVVYLAARHARGAGASLDWSALRAHAAQLDPGAMRLATGLVVLGYGTKVGLAPMHSWLPDAHGQAPAPVSALMSGVLLSVAFSVLLRFKAIADVTLGTSFSRALFAAVGLVSLALAASLLIAQRDLKRMLGYSSMEHMGIAALGAAAGGPLALGAVLLHLIGHGLAKSAVFLASGELLAAEGSTDIASLEGVLFRRPLLGAVLATGFLALLGLPPFALFVSEFTMVRAELAAGLGWAVAIALVCMAVAFTSIADHVRRMLLASPSARAPGGAPTPWQVAAPLLGALALCAVIGVAAWPLEGLLSHAALVVTR